MIHAPYSMRSTDISMQWMKIKAKPYHLIDYHIILYSHDTLAIPRRFSIESMFSNILFNIAIPSSILFSSMLFCFCSHMCLKQWSVFECERERGWTRIRVWDDCRNNNGERQRWEIERITPKWETDTHFEDIPCNTPFDSSHESPKDCIRQFHFTTYTWNCFPRGCFERELAPRK